MYAKDKSITDRREMLRVKLKSLAEEARIIRKEELKTWGQLRTELQLHRVGTVRHEARCTHLAYGLIRGRTLEQMEGNSTREATDRPIDWDKVKSMVKKYGPKEVITVPPVRQAVTA